MFSGKDRSRFCAKSPSHVAAAARAGESRLDFRGAGTDQGFADGNLLSGGDIPGQKFGLIESAVPLLAPMERDGNHGVELLLRGHHPV